MFRADLFQPEDLLLLEPQEAQLRDLPEPQRLEFGWRFKDGGSAFTIWAPVPVAQLDPYRPTAPLLEGDCGPTRMVPVLCCGSLRLHPGYAQLWALFSRYKPKVPVRLTRIVRRYVAEQPERRVEAQVAASHAGACGWARLVGLEEEARLRGAAPDGGDLIVFVRSFDAPSSAGRGASAPLGFPRKSSGGRSALRSAGRGPDPFAWAEVAR